MERINFSIHINAPRTEVWNVLWGKETYPKWTSIFHEDSAAETDWEEGSKILFTDGKGSGMLSMIANKVKDEYMAFKHLGMVKDGIEDTESEEVQQWAGAIESYKLNDENDGTRLNVEMDINDEYKGYFLETWPKALDYLKEIIENKKY